MELLPYHCDALLPQAERYASLKFRRLAQRIEIKLLTWEDLIELIAFVESIGGVKYARYIFMWKGRAVVRAYRRLKKYVGDAADAAVAANQSHMGVDVGLAVLTAMLEGGWKGKRTLPPVVKMSLKALRKQGNTISAISKATGLSREQVKTACDVRRKDGARSERAAAYSALALG
jgi:hypothetical protein